jgi:hypothetical protein
MAINNNVVKNYQTAEYGKFVEIINSSQFPPVSVVRLSYPDTSSAFPSNSGLKPLSSVDIYPKYAVLSYIANPEDISISLSAGNINVNLADLEDIARSINQNVNVTNTTLSATAESTLGQSGFVFLTGGQTALGQFSTIQVLSACKISALSANNTSVGSLYNFELPANFVLNGPIYGVTLAYGAAIVYKI